MQLRREAHLDLGHALRQAVLAELEQAQRALQFYPDATMPYEMTVRALAALGRVEEVRQAVDDSLTIHAPANPPVSIMATAASELRVHGNDSASLEFAERAVAWPRGRPAAELDRLELAGALFTAPMGTGG
jgi:hypothetical protein